MDRGAWWATDHGVAEESDMTEQLAYKQQQDVYLTNKGEQTNGSSKLPLPVL